MTKGTTLLLAPGGSLVISVPHPNDSQQFAPKPERTLTTQPIERSIGQTGVVGAMWHRDHWRASLLAATPDDYVIIHDEVKNGQGELKRQNMLFCPRGEQVVKTFRKLRRHGIIKDSPRFASQIGTALSDELRSVVKATNFKE